MFSGKTILHKEAISVPGQIQLVVQLLKATLVHTAGSLQHNKGQSLETSILTWCFKIASTSLSLACQVCIVQHT